MHLTALPIDGAHHIEIEPIRDARGLFARAWCRDEFAQAGLTPTFVQANLAHTHRAGTIRGFHYQAAPHEEDKYVRCLRGGVYDVMIDLRPESPSYLDWYGLEITAERRNALFIPAGCAHGYQTLVDDTEISYHVTAPYSPRVERGIRHDDPFFDVDWPRAVTLLSDKDQTWPDFDPQAHAREVRASSRA